MQKSSSLSGMQAFVLVWFGQLISLLGTSMTRFVLPIWAWQMTGQATALSLMFFFGFTPEVLLSPVAGALVDRWNRKLVMMLSDLGAGVVTIAIFLLYSTDNLAIWHLYVGGAITGAFTSFQFPAYSAAISTMIPKEQYARAFGMLSLAEPASQILAPLLAGILIGIIGISGIMLIDIVTFSAAIGTLLMIHVPQPEISDDGRAGQGSLWQESIYGFRYIVARPSLLGLQLVFFMINLVGTFGGVLLTPMILARTNENELALGSVLSIGAIGGVLGGILLSVWGGPKRKVHGILLGMFFASLAGEFGVGIGRTVAVWAAGSFISSLFLPTLNGSNQAIWQAKVPPDLQGRVFSARRMIAQITIPIAMLIAGPAADHVFEPGMQPDGALADAFGWLVGTGAGAGMGLMMVIGGLLGMMVGLGGYLFPPVRNAEDLLPDHDGAVKSDETAPAVSDAIVEAAV